MTTTTDLDAPRNYIAGTWRDAPVVPGRWNSDPNTGAHLHPMVTTNPDDVEEALAAAEALHRDGAWQDYPCAERAALLRSVADLIEERVEEIARRDSLTSGVPISTTRTIAGFIPGRFRTAAKTILEYPTVRTLEAGGRDVRLFSLPWGPAAILTPWNAPSFIAASKVASALAAGCPVVFKPSEWASSTAQPIAEAIVEASRAGNVPEGFFQVTHGPGDVGAALVGDARIRVISFTGGQAAGQAVARAASENFTVLQLELGGNNPVLVLADADVSATADSLARGMTLLNGQWCEGPGKVIAHSSTVESLVDALRTQLSTLRAGNSLDESTDIGPLVHQGHRDLLASRIEAYRQAGAKIIQPVEVPGDGSYLSPTLVVGLDADAATEELFGPVVTIHSVDSDDEALVRANDHPSGLDGFVYGTDLDNAMRIAARVASGEVRINGAHLDDLADGSAQGFWGVSGIGGHGPAEPVRVFRGDRVVGVDSPDLVI